MFSGLKCGDIVVSSLEKMIPEDFPMFLLEIHKCAELSSLSPTPLQVPS